MEGRSELGSEPRVPTARRADNTWRSKCKAMSRSRRRPCCPQFFGQANPTPATRQFVTFRCEFVPDLRALGLCVKDSGRGLDAQKFASPTLTTCSDSTRPFPPL